jgi:DNA repair protein RadD
MLQLRDYQRSAVDSIFDYWNEKPGNPLVVMATGTGKTPSFATLVMELLSGWPDMRVGNLTHVAELIEQSYLELVGMWPLAPAGIYSAGLGRRDAHAQILFAGIQTVHNKAEQIGWLDVINIDEAHLVPPDANTQYGRFIAAARDINPDLKVVGWTATDYRLDSGRLTEPSIIKGEEIAPLFDEVVFNYGIAEGIRDGFLCTLSSKQTATSYDLKGVGRQGGDYKQGALQKAVDKEAITREAVAEAVAKGADRKSWLMFCAGVDHAFHVRDEIRSHGISCETITGETPKGERRKILASFKAYELRALTNNSVLTTGFNHPGVDLIGFMRPTLSASLFVQMAGRGTRPIYARGMPLDTAEQRIAAIKAGPKPNCLVLDYANLVGTHGPVDMVVPKKPGSGTGEAPIKTCPQDQGGCGELVHASVRECPCCHYVFPPNEESKITAHAADVPILSEAEPDWRDVKSRTFRFHEGKFDKPPSVKVTYMCGYTPISEWVCPQHNGFPKTKSDKWWLAHGGRRPFPKSVLEWLERQNELRETTEISVVPNQKYWNVVEHRVGDYLPEGSNDNEPAAANDNGRPVSGTGWRLPNDNLARELDELDDDIAF